jgi:N-acetyl-gamma-glutamyl-phosphate reductase / acetylglutamate kinase
LDLWSTRWTPVSIVLTVELQSRQKIRDATHISNPGCYATAAQIGIAPLLEFVSAPPTIFGVSGYSGAGTKPSPKNDIRLLRDNLIPYSMTDHIHEREISHHLNSQAFFIPHVAQWFQGITHSINIPLSRKLTSRDIRHLYQDRYAGEQLVKVSGEAPLVRDISGRHGVAVGGFAVASSGDRVVLVATIDNLLKGAATQALQNINLSLVCPPLWGGWLTVRDTMSMRGFRLIEVVCPPFGVGGTPAFGDRDG